MDNRSLQEIYDEFKKNREADKIEQEITSLQREINQLKFIANIKKKNKKSVSKNKNNYYKKTKKANKEKKKRRSLRRAIKRIDRKVMNWNPTKSPSTAPVSKKSYYVPVDVEPAKITYEVMEKEEAESYDETYAKMKLPFVVGKFIDNNFEKIIKCFANEEEAYSFVEKFSTNKT